MTTEALAALQLPNGGFASTVVSRDGVFSDCNGFTTALVLRHTRHLPGDRTMTALRHRALQHVASCASCRAEGAFSFWPDAARPGWAAAMPADVDDTAIMLVELLRHGWIGRTDALRRLCCVMPCRVRESDCAPSPPWVVAGAFYTWIAHAAGANVVDCCVNANVAALMAHLDARHLPGYAAAMQTLVQGLRWADGDSLRMSSLTPFYPSVMSLLDAVEHAVESGVHELRDVEVELRTLTGDRRADTSGCCRSAYGSTVWHCAAVDFARTLAAQSPTNRHTHRDARSPAP